MLYAKAKTNQIAFIDAPVSGGQMGAEKGQLTIMCGGDDADFAKAKPIMDSYAKATTLMGASGAGQLTKMVNQICIAGLVQGLTEGLAFAEKAGLDWIVLIPKKHTVLQKLFSRSHSSDLLYHTSVPILCIHQ